MSRICAGAIHDRFEPVGVDRVLIGLAGIGWLLGAFLRTSGLWRIVILATSTFVLVGGGALLLQLQIKDVRVAVVLTQIVAFPQRGDQGPTS